MKLFKRKSSGNGKKKSSRLWRWGWKISLVTLVAGGALGVLIFYSAWAHTFDMKKVGEMPERNTVLDVDGKIYSRLAGSNRLIVSLNEVAPAFIDALLAREDTRFFQHNGIDYYGVGRALVRDLMSGSAREGASSITQQLARNSLPLGGRTVNRKLLEAMVAVQRDLNVLLTQDQIDQGGLYIYTTLDPAVQNVATQALESTLTRIEHQSNFHHPVKANYHPPEEGEDSSMPYLEGAVVVIDNASGGIRALVGGRDYSQSKFNRALPPANRQIGSSFKPFVYTLAFTNGLLPGAAISDGPIQPGEIEGAGNWAPGNSDGTYGGIPPASFGLIHSRNTMSVRVGQFAGLDQEQKIATTLNLNDKAPHGPAIYIGSFETNLKDLTTAYSAFPNAGVRKQSYIIERIDDQNHQPIYRAAHLSAPALDPSAAWMTSQLMEEVLTHGTAASARSLGLKLPAAGKNGTTHDYKDAWFVGYTSALTCGVWVGFDQPTTIIPRGYGAALALPVWVQVMNKSAARYPAKALEPTMPMARVTVCAASNALATTGCEMAGSAYDIVLPADKVPSQACPVHGGDATEFAQRIESIPNALPKLFQSVRQFFGGK